MSVLRLVEGDVTEFCGDAFVNDVSNSLQAEEGSDGVLLNDNLRSSLLELNNIASKLPHTDLETTVVVATTPSNNLGNVKQIVHTSGPRCPTPGVPRRTEEIILRLCYWKCLRTALAREIRQIAFPLISTGLCGYPRVQGLLVALDTILAFFGAHTQEAEALDVSVFVSGPDSASVLEFASSLMGPDLVFDTNFCPAQELRVAMEVNYCRLIPKGERPIKDSYMLPSTHVTFSSYVRKWAVGEKRLRPLDTFKRKLAPVFTMAKFFRLKEQRKRGRPLKLEAPAGEGSSTTAGLNGDGDEDGWKNADEYDNKDAEASFKEMQDFALFLMEGAGEGNGYESCLLDDGGQVAHANLEQETQEEYEIRLQKTLERARQRLAEETEEERQRRLSAIRETNRKTLAKETPEQCQRRLQRSREFYQKQKASPEENEKRKAYMREWNKRQRKTETPEQRERRLISERERRHRWLNKLSPEAFEARRLRRAAQNARRREWWKEMQRQNNLPVTGRKTPKKKKKKVGDVWDEKSRYRQSKHSDPTTEAIAKLVEFAPETEQAQ